VGTGEEMVKSRTVAVRDRGFGLSDIGDSSKSNRKFPHASSNKRTPHCERVLDKTGALWLPIARFIK